MRKKMNKNDMFYIHYPYRPDMENSVSKMYSCYSIIVCLESKLLFYVLNFGKGEGGILNLACPPILPSFHLHIGCY